MRLKQIHLRTAKKKTDISWYNIKKGGSLVGTAPKNDEAEETKDVAAVKDKDADKILEDEGKQFYRFHYETCTSKGPSLHKDFKDPLGTLDGVSDGKWLEGDEEEDCCEHQEDSEPCNCPLEREYLVVTFWRFDDAQGLLEVMHEYSIEAPTIDKENSRPLNISE